MQGDSSSVLAAAPGDTTAASVAAATTPVHEGGGGGLGSNSGEEDKNTTRVDEADRLMGHGANRWPRQETLALLKIRSDMDAAFRDSSHKGALWEEVSRKLAELGYHRTPKKCKEKFENVFKYHKRTKEGRTGKSEGKIYRFFDQLEAFENIQPPLPSSPPAQPPSSSRMAATTTTTTTVTMQWPSDPPLIASSHVAVPSTQNIVASNISIIPAAAPIPTPTTQPVNPPSLNIYPSSFQNLSTHLFSSSTSSSTASDEELDGGSRKRKRKWKGFFERLTKDVLRKQEEIQKRFLEAVERNERERMVREEAWRMQEMARINREHEILIQERSAAAAKDAAIISYLQRMSGQEASVQKHDNPTAPPRPPEPALVVTTPIPTAAAPPSRHPSPPVVNVTNMELDFPRRDNGDNVNVSTSSSRWPKAEVLSLISLRTSLDVKYQQNGPKGPLWEEISAGMLKLGYNRSAKRCKEKWENINKYFKKVKESSKKRPEDSKTCPYFHQLDALYKEKSKSIESSASAGFIAQLPVGLMEPLMVRPEQQWPPPTQALGLDQSQNVNARENVDKVAEEEEEGEDDYEDEEEGDTEEEDEGGGFEVVPNKASLGNGE